MSKNPEYKSISIKEEFAQSIEDFIRDHPTLGYRALCWVVAVVGLVAGKK